MQLFAAQMLACYQSQVEWKPLLGCLDAMAEKGTKDARLCCAEALSRISTNAPR